MQTIPLEQAEGHLTKIVEKMLPGDEVARLILVILLRSDLFLEMPLPYGADWIR